MRLPLLSLYIANKLRLSGDGLRSKSPSTIIAVIGVALSVIVMALSISVVSGFKNEITAKVMGFGSHVTIHAETPYDTDDSLQSHSLAILHVSSLLDSVIAQSAAFQSPEFVFEQPAVLKTKDDFEGIVVRGVPPAQSYEYVSGNLVDGDTDNFFDGDNIVISRITANRLTLAVGDNVNIAFVVGDKVRLRRLSVKAVYDSHFSDFDKLYSYVPLSLMQNVNRLDSLSATHINLFLKPGSAISSVAIDDAAYRLQSDMVEAVYSRNLQGTYRISTVNQTGAVYFNWLALLDTNIVVILIIMSLVSGFTLVSSLFIIILQRVRTIGVLKSMGGSSSLIRDIFIFIGWRLVAAGMLFGNIIAIAVIAVQKLFHIVPLDPEAYYLAYVPVELNFWYFLLLNLGVFFLSWILLLIPARIVSGISPAATMRYT